VKSEAFFVMHECEIHFHPNDKPGMKFDPDEEAVTLNGVLRFTGFTAESGRITNCNFIRDEDIPAGTILVRRKIPVQDDLRGPFPPLPISLAKPQVPESP
jgi:hypothetical protein